jgi:hypothetical protein
MARLTPTAPRLDAPARSARGGHTTRGAVLAAVAAGIAGCGGGDAPPPPRVATATVTPATAVPKPAEPVTASVWGLERPGRAAARLRRHPAVASVTVVRRTVALLRAERAGYAIPLDVLEVDPRTVSGVPRSGVALSRTGARLRRARVGSRLRFADGAVRRVRAVVSDEAALGAELVVARTGGSAGRASVRLELTEAVTPGRLVRVAGGGAARVGDSGPAGPARPAELKARFGEPAVRLPFGADWVTLDPGFRARYLRTRTVPILGSVTCHRAMLPRLHAALADIQRRGLARLVGAGDFAGCFAPRRISPEGALSLHAWGLAVDLNASSNPFGGRSRQDPRLVRTMQRHGFSWGGDWPTRPDPMHFEYRGRMVPRP